MGGVFWFSDNPAGELLLSLEGVYFNAAKRWSQLKAYGMYQWTFDDGWLGYLYQISMKPIVSVGFQWNDDYTYADMPFMLFGLINLSYFGADCLMKFTIKQLDDTGAKWARDTYIRGKLSDYAS